MTTLTPQECLRFADFASQLLLSDPDAKRKSSFPVKFSPPPARIAPDPWHNPPYGGREFPAAAKE